MFIMKEYFDSVSVLYKVNDCLIFWPEEEKVPEEIENRNAIKNAKILILNTVNFIEIIKLHICRKSRWRVY